MEMHKVASSNIEAIGYDPEKRVLRIKFHTGKTYEYEPITQEAYNEFKAAESLGQYFYKYIRTNDRVTTTQINE